MDATNESMVSIQGSIVRKRSLPNYAALVLVAITIISSSLDTIHGFAESFPARRPQYAIPAFSTSTLSRSKAIRTNPYSEPLARHIDPSRAHSQLHSPPIIATTSSTLFYAPNPDTSKTAPMVAQAFYSSHKSNCNPTKPKQHSSKSSSTLNSAFPPLSNSVLSSSDTLPSFPTAHGLLSPETVLRMENRMKMQQGRGEEMVQSRAVNIFLERYKNEGPMACLPFLSDEEVLPRLTEAMRYVL